MKIFKTIMVLTLFCPLWLMANQAMDRMAVSADSTQLPKVFIIGEHEEEFNNLTLQFQTLLLEACDDNMDVAYDKWLSMLEEMEAYANLNNFDLKGIKMWINVFWEKDGSIKHLAYYLKPQSKNVDTRFLTAFLTEFIKVYRFPLVHTDGYSHYGIANFPVFPRRLGNGGVTNPGTPALDSKQLVKDKND